MKLESRFWLEEDGVKVFGKGPLILLEAVDKLGTLNKAANKLDMSYSKAWSMIKRAEAKLGFSLLERHTGGIEGGGSDLTPEARALIKSYRNFCKEADNILDELYNKHFENGF
ncbi:winged helix-turn-helix domain-containing protein [Lutispora saccharofermentans]|uniref:LysR family transcriptional regulator n=1 Tax=Lutispora saccharofermentans TaxID=3024236 RepID=A0ABT1NG81_9FIRM|nr:LysR family transcriptional regulator [Lutispora saccharofermentans]MCQ1528856.1 LysR family transcriptional regulator [Lutispora saccharofermentans]